MTARLLPPDKLTALLCKLVYGETPAELAQFYGLSRIQVSRLLNNHRKTLWSMKEFLTVIPKRSAPRPAPKSAQKNFRKICNWCRAPFLTDNKLMFTCKKCKGRDDWKQGEPFGNARLTPRYHRAGNWG